MISDFLFRPFSNYSALINPRLLENNVLVIQLVSLEGRLLIQQ